MSCLHHILPLWYNTFTNKCWHRNTLQLGLHIPWIHFPWFYLFFYQSCQKSIRKIYFSTTYIQSFYSVPQYTLKLSTNWPAAVILSAVFIWVSINLAFKYMGLSSTDIKSTKLGPAQPNQRMQYRKVTRKTERENTASSSVIVNSFIVLLKKKSKWDQAQLYANLKLILSNHTEKMNNCNVTSKFRVSDANVQRGQQQRENKHEQHMQVFQRTQVLSLSGNRT